ERSGAETTGTERLTGAAREPARTTAVPGDRHVVVPPAVASGIRVRYLDPGAPWSGLIGARAGSPHLEAAVAARVHLRYDDAASGVDHTEIYECVFFPLTDAPRAEDAHAVDYDERDLRTEPPAPAMYGLPTAPIERATF